MTEGNVALICSDCRWLLAGLPAREAAAVPRCLACGGASLVREPVADGVRMARWSPDEERPGWAVFSRPRLDALQAVVEARN